jgi:hypothetical protein
MHDALKDEVPMFVGSKDEVINGLKDSANSKCSKCFGRGYTGWKELDTTLRGKSVHLRTYIPCKCVLKKKDNNKIKINV